MWSSVLLPEKRMIQMIQTRCQSAKQANSKLEEQQSWNNVYSESKLSKLTKHVAKWVKSEDIQTTHRLPNKQILIRRRQSWGSVLPENETVQANQTRR